MKILVPVKRVPDTDQKIEVRADGSGVDTSQLPFIINPFDAIALEEAVRIREGGVDAEILAVGVGDAKYEEQLRSALAMGADRALRIDSDQPLDPWNTACVLRAIVDQESPDLVLMGKQAVDGDCNQTGQFLAAMLGWPQATFASAIKLSGDWSGERSDESSDESSDRGLRVDRETDSGIETVELPCPAVISVDLRLNEPRYASLPSIMKARKKEIVEISMSSLGIENTPRVRTVSVRSDKSARKRIMVDSNGELVTCLREALKTE